MTSAWRPWRALPALVVAWTLALAGCASQPEKLPPGMPRAEVLQALGQPTAIYPIGDDWGGPAMKGGQRLQYSMQPAGQRVYNVDLDASGRLVRAEQALNEGLFPKRILPDRWTQEDVLREYGRPARIEAVHNFNGRIWVWRYADGPIWRLLFIDIDPQGIVRGYSVGDEPMPDPPDPPR